MRVLFSPEMKSYIQEIMGAILDLAANQAILHTYFLIYSQCKMVFLVNLQKKNELNVQISFLYWLHFN